MSSSFSCVAINICLRKYLEVLAAKKSIDLTACLIVAMGVLEGVGVSDIYVFCWTDTPNG